MSHFIKTGAAALGIAMLGTTPLMAQPVAQNTPPSQQQALSPAMRADIETGLRYTLPGDFLTRAAETLQALQAANIRPPNSTRLSLQQTISQIASTPGVPEILNAHGFTPESFTMGITAFGMTLAATNGQTLPAGFPAPNPSNVALFHTHPEQVTALMQAMGTPPGQN